MDDDFDYDEDCIEADLADEDWDYLDTIDLIDWTYDQLLAAGWDPGNHTRGISPSRAVLIVEGPTGDGYVRQVVVPSTGMTGTEFADVLKRAAAMTAMANQAHPVVSEEPDGD